MVVPSTRIAGASNLTKPVETSRFFPGKTSPNTSFVLASTNNHFASSIPFRLSIA